MESKSLNTSNLRNRLLKRERGIIVDSTHPFMIELNLFLQKRPDILKQIKKDNNDLERAIRIHKAMCQNLTVPLLSILYNKGEENFSELVEDFEVKPEMLHKEIDQLNDLGLVNIQFKRQSPLQMYVSISDYGKLVLKNIIKVKKGEASKWKRLYKKDKVSEELQKIIPLL